MGISVRNGARSVAIPFRGASERSRLWTPIPQDPVTRKLGRQRRAAGPESLIASLNARNGG